MATNTSKARRKSAKAPDVYCFQLGDTGCFKIGRSVNPNQRKRAFSTASPVELIERRCEPSEHPEALEKYVHELLEPKRVINRREVFDVTMQEVSEAFATAVPIVNEAQKLLDMAAALAKNKPVNRTMSAPSKEVTDLYRRLRKAQQDQFFLQCRIEVLESKIKLAIGDNLGIQDIVSWDWRTGSRIDIDKLKKQRPRLYKLLLKRFEANLSGRRCKWA
ncbi:MAG: GIY-YIG nuclease family protein [Bryobacteraceae bacterium]